MPEVQDQPNSGKQIAYFFSSLFSYYHANACQGRTPFKFISVSVIHIEKLEDTKPTNEGSSVVPILEDLPSPTFGNSPADNICGNLQLLFALMKYSEKRCVVIFNLFFAI